MFQNVLIICIGNICRSPMAEQMFRHAMGESGPLFSSAGIGALVGNPMDPTAVEVLGAHGIVPGPHLARQVESHMLHQADLILAMEMSHLQHLRQIAPEVHGKTFLIGKWQSDVEIPDPFRQPRPAFEQVHGLLANAVESWLPYLK